MFATLLEDLFVMLVVEELRAFNDHAASFAPVRSRAIAVRFQFLEFKVPLA